nr:MAG TPA: hypothetical protein [Caudoviricetes sp.]DAQ58939.1 MAG TPA: hypothetical protein [Caudoviricetes sp.]
MRLGCSSFFIRVVASQSVKIARLFHAHLPGQADRWHFL